MKRQKIKSYIAAAMTLSVFATGLGVETWAVNAGEKGESFKKVIEFEDTNKFSDNEGNGVRSDLFSDYSGNGFVYLASGWSEVNFDVPSDGKYKITVVTTSDQDKENWLYLDEDGAGKLYTKAGQWNKTTNEYTLTKGSHKFGVSSDWGYVALDYVIVERVDGGSTGSSDHGPEGPVVDVAAEGKTVCEFEAANRFSNDEGNKVANDEFKGYTGDGYVYLAQGWSDVKFNIPEAGKYKITVRSNSDQDKENFVYSDDKSVGKLNTKANKWNESSYQVTLSAGEHKFGVSTDWGYVALDSITIEKVSSTTKPPVTPPVDPAKKGTMHVDGTKLCDGQGNEFVMRGVNIAHAWYTDKTETSINAVAGLGANTVRVVLADGTQWTKTTRAEVENIIKLCRQKGLVCVLEVHDHTGFNEPERLQNAVNYWKDLKDLLNANKDYVIVNIANEWLGDWGHGDVWTSTYTKAIKELRSAGLENLLMIDAAGYGQETATLIDNCQQVYSADPAGNTMFSIHMYSVAGKDASTVKSNIDSMLGKGVCTAIGEFGDFQNGADVDEATILSYSNEKKMGTIAWSWKGNGGQDMSLDLSNDWEGKNLTQWGKYAFLSTNGIKNTSKLAYSGTTGGDTTGGDTTGGDDVEPPKPPVTTPVDPINPDVNAKTNIKPGYLSSIKDTEWYVSSKGDDTKSESSTVTNLIEGGKRVSFDLAEDPYPYLVNMCTGLDLSKNNKMSVVVRNNTTSALQIQPIFKVGDEYEWTEYDRYKEIPALTTVQLDFDMSKCPNKDAVNAMLFRVQGAGSKAKGSVDFLSVTPDLAESTYKGQIAELNRPKTASYFTWAYPEASFKDQTTSATCNKDGVISIDFKNVTAENAAGIQTETKPGLGKGIDCSGYKTLTCAITNPNPFDVSATLLLRSSSNWTWQENQGVTADGKPCDVIPAGKTVNVTYKLKDSTWKSKASNWEYTGAGQDLDDVRAIAFKIWTNGSGDSGNVKISNFSFNFGDTAETPETPTDSEKPTTPTDTEKPADTEKPTTPTDTEKPADPVAEGAFHVQGTTLYDGKGNPFVMRGVNIAHAWYTDKTKTSIDAVAKLGANTVRVVLADGTQWTKTTRSEVENIIKWCREKGLVCVLEVHDHTGFDDPSRLQNAVNYWKDLKDLLNANKDYVIVNVANEWLGTWGKGSTWTSTYTKAIKELRDAGLENVIMVDAAGYGQETSTLIDNCQTVKAADPTGNTMFSIHMYSVAGKDASTVKNNIDSMLGKGVCTCIGEFGDFQNGGDVDEETIINYSEEKKMGTIAWSWKGNGGQDMSLDMSNDWEGNNLTKWGAYVFNSTNGIHNTSKLAYTLKTPDGTVVNPDKPDKPDIPVVGGDTEDPDANVDTNIKPGLLGSLKDWYVSSKGDDTKSTSSTLEQLKDGGYRVSFDLSEDPYPYLVNMTKGVDFSNNGKVSLIVRNNTPSALQIQPIFKVGDEYEWTEYAQYKEIPALTAVQLDFDLSKCPNKDAVNAILFRIQGAGSKVKGSMDFLNVSADLPEATYAGAIAELNRPKTASYFTWAYPEASFKDQTTSAKCDENGVISIAFKNVSSENATGIQTETKPGLGKGIDCSPYSKVTCTIKNPNPFDVSASLLLRSSSNWTWQETQGVTVDGKTCDVIPAGKTVKVTYSLKDATWKSKASNWEYTGKCQDPDDVRAIAFKIWTNGSSDSGEVQISDMSFEF